MSLFSNASDRQVNIGLTILRIVVGMIFIAHGGQKLFVLGLDGVTAGFTQMGMPMAGILAPLVAFVEFFGGLALVTGLLTRLAALGLATTMIVAILKVHLPAGFFAPSGIEFPLSLLGSSLLLALTGAGKLSLDSLIASHTSKVIPAGPPAERIRRAA